MPEPKHPPEPPCPAFPCPTAASSLQAAQRGQKQGSATQPDENDPLADRYGDTELVQARLLLWSFSCQFFSSALDRVTAAV